MEEDDLLTPKSKRAQRLENLHLKSKSELISSPFLDEETIIKIIDTTLQPIRKSIKDIEYDVKEVNLQLGLKAGPNEMSAFERRFEMYCTEYQFK